MAHIGKGSNEANGSVAGTTFLMLKGMIGTMVLCLPRLFLFGGLIGSVVILTVMALLAFWGMSLLHQSSMVVPGSYQNIAKKLYGPRLQQLVSISLVLCQYGFASIFMVFVATNIMDLVSTVSDCQYQLHDWSLAIAVQLVVYIPLVLVRDIQGLVKYALAGNILTVIGISYCLYTSASQLAIKPGQFDLVSSPGSMALFIGSAIYSYEGFGLVIPISNSMKDPKQFRIVLMATMIFVTTVYLILGCLGLMAYGNDAEQIMFMNMPASVTLELIQLGYVFAVTLSWPLQFFPAVQILENQLFEEVEYTVRKKLFRILLAFVAALIAFVGANSLDVFVSFVGAFCGMPISFVYPCLFYLKACARTRFQKYSTIALLTFGVMVSVFASGIAFQTLLFGEAEEGNSRCTNTDYKELSIL